MLVQFAFVRSALVTRRFVRLVVVLLVNQLTLFVLVVLTNLSFAQLVVVNFALDFVDLINLVLISQHFVPLVALLVDLQPYVVALLAPLIAALV